MASNQEIQDTQKQVWDSAAPGWKKWDGFLTRHFAPVSDLMLQAAKLREGDRVLEMACGTGEPGIPAARKVGKGMVIGTDLSEDMMAVARDKAKAQGLPNYSTKYASALSLPFAEGEFDAVLCRWGIMFFPDPSACLKETIRVLKPGARAVFATWNNPPKNPHISLAMSTAISLLGIQPPPPDMPGVFRFPDPAKVAGLMEGAGFKEVGFQEAVGTLEYASVEDVWNMSYELVGPFRAALKNASPELQQKVKDEVLSKASAMAKDGKVPMTYSSWVISGVK